MRTKPHQFDYSLFVFVLILLVLGIMILSSVSTVFAQNAEKKISYFLLHQIGWGIIPGIILGYLAYRMPLAYFKRWALPAVVMNLFLMILVFFPKIGVSAGGAARWLRVSSATLQPSEFLKLTFIFYLSVWLANRTEENLAKKQKDGDKTTLLPFLAIIGVIGLLLILQSDLGTLLIILAAAFLVYFCSKTPWWHTSVIIAVIAAAVMFLVVFEPYRLERILTFLNIKNDPMGTGYQTEQTLITVGSGGISGTGLGGSGQKLGSFLPQPMTDSIFAIFSEEAGFVGCFALVGLFWLLVWRAFKIAKASRDKFAQLLALGIGSWIGAQAFINIGAIIGILPLTGVPLPFISYGGSHIISEIIGVGLLLNISKTPQK